MKRFIISLILIFATWQAAFAISYERAREEALYLTDKMAYELNLNNQQYNDAYEINLDYFLSLNNEADLYEDYLSYRLSDLRHILYDWQYNIMIAADYFIRPVYWKSGGWHFYIYNYYHHGYFYYSYPTVYYSYRGGHGRIHHHHGFYANRRPTWNGGLRDHQETGGRHERSGHGSTAREREGIVHGDGFHFDVTRRGERNYRGNSFENSSTRNPRNDYSRRDGNVINKRNGSNIERNNETNGTERGIKREYRNQDFHKGYGESKSSGVNNRYSIQRFSGSNSSYIAPRSSEINRKHSSPGNPGFSRGFSGQRGPGSGGNLSRGRR